VPPAPAPTAPNITAYVALGANLGDRAANLRSALARLADAPGVTVTRVSSFLENPAVGGPDGSPPFLNAVAEVVTSLDAPGLLGRLLAVERAMGRVRDARWGPRLIDLDLVLFGDAVIDTPDLKVPHPLMHERDFVLVPLNEIAPDVRHPTLGKAIGELVAAPTAKGKLVANLAPEVAVGKPGGAVPGGAIVDAGLSLVLRPATNADGPAVRDLVFSVLREYGLKPDPCGTDLDLFDLEGNYPLAGGRFDVLVDAAGIVRGTAGLRPVDAGGGKSGGARKPGGACELRKMYLHRSARGRGWGRRLLAEMLAEARRRGFERVTLETASALTEAVRLYERYGFTPYAPGHMVAARCDQAYQLKL
jgi:2-amino-4-hydroxy-6-hydroxymethyldihydropteridine diphosphokinase